MNCETKSDRIAECFRIGRQIYNLDQRTRRPLLDEIRQLEDVLADLDAQIVDIEQDLANIQNAQDAARTLRSRGPAGLIVGEVTAQAIQLAMRKDQLERAKLRLEAQRSRSRHELDAKRRRLNEIDRNLDGLNSTFRALNCPLGARPF